jgi:hypothetical protein
VLTSGCRVCKVHFSSPGSGKLHLHAVMDPLLDTVPPEAAVDESSLAGRMVDGWSKSKVLGSLLKCYSKLKQHEIT